MDLNPFLNALTQLLSKGQFWWLLPVLAAVILYEIVMSRRYGQLARDAALTPHVAPLTIKGGIAAELEAKHVGLMLRAELAAVSDLCRKPRRTSAPVTLAAPLPKAFGEMMDLATTSLQITLPEKSLELRVEETLTVKLGTIEVPVGAIWKLVHGLLTVIPVRHRKAYFRSRINVSLISLASETQLLVYTENRGSMSAVPAAVLSKSAPVNTLGDLQSLLRDAAFMIVQLHPAAFPVRNWVGMSNFVEGMSLLERYQAGNAPEALLAAETSFRKAIEGDPGGHLAYYFLASIQAARRKPETIDEAITLFHQALGTPDKRFRALVCAGLTHCYAQQYHRGAKREPEVLEKVGDFVRESERQWRDAGETELHPLILYALAFAQHVDEGTPATRSQTCTRYITAAEYYLEALAKEPDNAMFHNNLGWVFLKLAEWGVPEITSSKFPDKLSGHPAEHARRHLARSLELYSANKLADANLCLLYGTPYFRNRPDAEIYLERARYYGQVAVQLDPGYDNGYRDLALTLIRYKQLDEAYQRFEDALRAAPRVEKDQEIISDILAVLNETGITDEAELRRWRHPNPALLTPASAPE